MSLRGPWMELPVLRISSLVNHLGLYRGAGELLRNC